MTLSHSEHGHHPRRAVLAARVLFLVPVRLVSLPHRAASSYETMKLAQVSVIVNSPTNYFIDELLFRWNLKAGQWIILGMVEDPLRCFGGNRQVDLLGAGSTTDCWTISGNFLRCIIKAVRRSIG